MADKLNLRAWILDLRTWILGFMYLVFKTTYMDEEAPLREAAFFFTRISLAPLGDKRNIRDRASPSLYHVEKKPLMRACCILACYRFLGTHSGVDLAGDWCLFQARILALLMMFNASCLLLNSRSLLEYIFVLYYLCMRIGFLCI